MRVILFAMLLLTVVQPLLSQSPAPLSFYGQPVLEHGISVEPYALFYEDPAGDTTRLIQGVAQQQFVSALQAPFIKYNTFRQMKRTTQVIWIQFRIANSHPTDTLHLWYAGGAHALFSLYKKTATSFRRLGDGGLCTNQVHKPFGSLALPLDVAPHTSCLYYIRIVDYLLLITDIAGEVHTKQSFEVANAKEISGTRWLFAAMAMIIGCLLLMSIYSFFQYLLNHDNTFLYYTIYALLACCLLIELSNPRFGLGLAPASMPWLGHPVAFSFSHIIGFVYALFITSLLSVPQHQPHFWRLIRPLMVCLVLLQVMVVVQLFTGLLIGNTSVYFLVDTLPALLMGLLLIAATIKSRSKLKPYLLTGEISLFVITISPVHGVFMLNHVSPQLSLFLNYPPFFMALGLFTELFCFALALAYRNKLIEMEKNALQHHYTIQLEAELVQRTQKIREQSLQLEQQHASQLEQAFEQKLAEMEMTALRAQMNPHFIFNCLNSIKLYTTDNNAVKATDYLTKFSRLIRLVLENSRSECVTLENELEALQLYLEMEAMRFKDKLQFSIQVAPDLDTGLVEIPPLLLQPYVENAIWHGLMHKKKGGNVQIQVMQIQADRLCITITDDGIGRTKASSLNSKSATAHKSFGMKVTGERIALINQIYKTNTRVQIHDLIDGEGNATGTKVVLEILI